MTGTVIGLIGGIGSGKSTVAGMFSRLGARVFDADAYCHELLGRDEIISSVIAEFGPDIVVDGSIDRRSLGSIVFSDPDSLLELERILHGPVRKQIMNVIDSLTPEDVLVIDAPLLLEKDASEICDMIIFIKASQDHRSRRMAERGWGDGELEKREARQLPVDEKMKSADIVIENGGLLSQTEARVKEVWDAIPEPSRDH